MQNLDMWSDRHHNAVCSKAEHTGQGALLYEVGYGGHHGSFVGLVGQLCDDHTGPLAGCIAGLSFLATPCTHLMLSWPWDAHINNRCGECGALDRQHA